MRLLTIEDNVALCNSMKLGLMKSGFWVDTVYTGIEGEEKAYSNEYDTILLDLNLPEFRL